MNGTLKKLNEKMKMKDDLFKVHVVQLVEHYAMDEKMKVSNFLIMTSITL